MALGDLLIKVGIDGTNINKDLAKVQRKLEASAAKFSTIGANISMGISAPLGILGTQAITTAAEFQTLETGLQTLTGSVDKGTAAFERLKEFSAATPFQLQDLVAANNTMMGFGLTADDAFTSLNQLGDIAAVMGSDLNSMSLAFGQSAASGVAMTADINQFINQGVPMYKLLEEVTGKNTKELKKMASESKITFPLIQKALKKATEEGGMFFEGMAKGSQTLGGVLSTFKDKLALALGTLGESIAETINFKEVVGQLGTAIGKATDFFAGLSDTTKKIIIGVTGVIAVLGPLMFALGGLINVLSSAASGLQLLNTMLFANPYVLAAAGIAAIAVAIHKMSTKMTTSEKVVDKYNKRLDKLTAKGVAPHITALDQLNRKLVENKQKGEDLSEIKEQLLSKYGEHIDNAKELGDSYEELSAAIDQAKDSLKEYARNQAFQQLAKEIMQDLIALQAESVNFEIEVGASPDKIIKLAEEAQKLGEQSGNALREMKKLFKQAGVKGDARKRTAEAKELLDKIEATNMAYKQMSELGKFAADEVEEKTKTTTKATAKAEKATKTYKDELKELFNLVNDGVVHEYSALASALDVVNSEMDKLSRTNSKNVFGESAKDIDEYRELLEGLTKKITIAKHPFSPEEMKKAFADLVNGIGTDIPDLTLQPTTVNVKPKRIQFDFSDVTEALDTLGLGGQIGSAFENLFNKLEEAGKKLGEGIKSGIMIGVAAFDLVNQGFAALMDAQQRKLDAAHELEMNRIEASTASEEVKQKRKALAEKVYEKKSQAIKKRMAQRDKAQAIFEATINTAAAMTKVLGTPLMAVVAALGAAQVAMIASTPIPMANGGILSGPTNILAGEYMGARNNPEIIAPLDKLRNMINTEQNINLQGAFRLTGDDLLLAVEQANKTRQRQGGITLF